MYLDCHAKGIAHRDVKPQNILISESIYADGVPCLRLCDFAFARHFDNPSASRYTARTVVGTFDAHNRCCWMAPEISECQADPNKTYDAIISDIFSLGCLFTWIALEGKGALYHSPAERDNAEARAACLNRIAQFPLLRDLVCRMTTNRPADRISLHEVEIHPAMLSVANFVSIFRDIGNQLKSSGSASENANTLRQMLEAVPFNPDKLNETLKKRLISLGGKLPTNGLELLKHMRNALEHVNESKQHPKELVERSQHKFLEDFISNYSEFVVDLFNLLVGCGKLERRSQEGFCFSFDD